MPHFRRTDMSHGQTISQPIRIAARRTCHRALLLMGALLGATACENRRSTPAVDSSIPLRPATIGTSGAPTPTTWDAHLG
ncbi:MAG TPA: hypothetical protein VFD67_15055, partial [Gemmatimonadaceae bacterium]|nr:hypothetical protein [Gemmatimonadaceae bacterium]